MVVQPDSFEQLEQLASYVKIGQVVAAAKPEQIAAWRDASAKLPNVVLLQAKIDGSIDWQDEYFDKVYAPHVPELEEEILRVLLPNGLMYASHGTFTRPPGV